MEQRRLILAMVLSVLVILIWQAYVAKTHKQRVPPQQTTNQTSKNTEETVIEPKVPSEKEISSENQNLPATPSKEIKPTRPAKIYTIDTPMYIAVISDKGAVFKSFKLKHYKESVQKDAPYKELIDPESKLQRLVTGFANLPGLDIKDALFEADSPSRNVSISNQPITISFSYTAPDNITIYKKFTFSPDTYLIGFKVETLNQSASPISDQLVLSLKHEIVKDKSRYAFTGPSTYIDQKLDQFSVKDIKKDPYREGHIQWVAIEDHYFVSCIVPLNSESSKIKVHTFGDNGYENQYFTSQFSLPSGSRHDWNFNLYFGPKKISTLKQIGFGLEKMINFGWFDFLARPCLWLMNFLYKYIPNYGVAIIILTLFTKILMWPLGSKSYKSMNQMKKLQPLMAEIREKYKDDRQRMNQEIMMLYKTYKINPLGGCLPMVLQIPVFFALYRMLGQAIELRHAPFFMWINDLSAPDRLFHFTGTIPLISTYMTPPIGIPVLTIIMGASMFLQQKMSPPPGDPSQAKMMMLMPIVFTFIFINFSSGLVLYWLTSNILSMAQQYYTNKKLA